MQGYLCRAEAAGGPRRQVELYAVISDAEHICLVMEYCRGGDLFKELARGGGALEEAWVSAQARPCRLRAPARARPGGPLACLPASGHGLLIGTTADWYIRWEPSTRSMGAHSIP